MNVFLRQAPPIVEEIRTYGKKQFTRKVKKECQKIGLFQVRVRGMNFEDSKNIVHEIRQCLYRPSGYIGLQCLSEVEWGHPAEYNEEDQVYDDYICIPKDFDNPKEQIKEILRAASMKTYEIKTKYNKRCYQKLIEKEKTEK